VSLLTALTLLHLPLGQVWSALVCCTVFSKAPALHTLVLKLVDQSKFHQLFVVT
jgi:hypothetical protein